ncbi:glycosyltransferase [Nitrospira sp. NS4]|uniref:glycosyltransferase n=1 Tax=Nitrospira sp. NS4 TaxID=3414498 RepID=UPI003C300BD1
MEALFNLRPVRWAAAGTFLLRGTLFLLVGNYYRGMSDLCWVSRVSGVDVLKTVSDAVIQRVIERVRREGKNVLVDSFLSDKAATACASLYSLTGLSAGDIFRDVIVLKSSTSGEKGVILIKYARTFEAVIALFDLPRLLDRYVFVLEPCWAGYCDPSILMFIAPGHPVIVQCFTEEDHRFISSIGAPFVPIRLGPADWVDADLFATVHSDAKQYDLVMVANWEPHKRHAQLFRALSEIKGRNIRVLLVGFQLGGRTADDIRKEADIIRNPLIEIEILEKLPPRELARVVGQCKAFVFLSKKEGDNKALVEAMFVDVPAVVFDRTIGGARSRINPSTGILASDEQLAEKIIYMLDHYKEFRPRAWALQHTGSSIATRVLNEEIKRIAIESGGRCTESIAEKTNSPNLTYKDPSRRDYFKKDYEFILSCQRRSLRSELLTR